MFRSKNHDNYLNFLNEMERKQVAILIHTAPGMERNALTEEKYKKLGADLTEKGFDVQSISYNDQIADPIFDQLKNFDAILVWVNPIEQGNDRKILDAMLKKLADHGCSVSAHPDVIVKMGTKEILYKTRAEEFGSDVKLYASFDEFKQNFLSSSGGIRILKQYRGNGGNGVFKVDTTDIGSGRIVVTHATKGDEEKAMTREEFFDAFKSYLPAGSMLIDQPWNANIVNGMVRCYLSGNKVAGFGYQEVNALYPKINSVFKKPSQRFYYTEDCGIFSDLKKIMQESWISRLQTITGIKTEMLPAIWDADFFINKINSDDISEKYTLCEINVSSVSPFPESAIPYITRTIKERLNVQ